MKKKNCISQATGNIFKKLAKSQQANKPSSLAGRQREGVRKCLPSKPVQPEGQCESFKGNAQPPSTDPRMMGECPDHCWCQHVLCWYVGGIDVLAPERKNQAEPIILRTSPNYFQVISQVCTFCWYHRQPLLFGKVLMARWSIWRCRLVSVVLENGDFPWT